MRLKTVQQPGNIFPVIKHGGGGIMQNELVNLFPSQATRMEPNITDMLKTNCCDICCNRTSQIAGKNL